MVPLLSYAEGFLGVGLGGACGARHRALRGARLALDRRGRLAGSAGPDQGAVNVGFFEIRVSCFCVGHQPANTFALLIVRKSIYGFSPRKRVNTQLMENTVHSILNCI